MRSVLRLAAALAAAAGLALAATDARAQASSFDQVFAGAEDYFASQATNLEETPDSPEKAARLASLAKAGAAAAKARENPSPSGFLKAGGKIDRILRKPWTGDEGMPGWLANFANQQRALLHDEWETVVEIAENLPDEEAAALVLEDLEVAGLDMEGLSIPETPEAFAPFYREMGRLAVRLAAARRKILRVVNAAAGKKGMTATLEGSSFKAEATDGYLMLDAWSDVPYSMVVQGSVNSFDWGDGNPERTTIQIGVDGGAILQPGTYTVGGEGGATGYFERGFGRTSDSFVLTTGSVTILYVDALAGEIAGTFSVAAVDGEIPLDAVEGRFHFKGLPTFHPE
jgi:hypothetical protein